VIEGSIDGAVSAAERAAERSAGVVDMILADGGPGARGRPAQICGRKGVAGSSPAAGSKVDLWESRCSTHRR
jgi:hypothetical protein